MEGNDTDADWFTASAPLAIYSSELAIASISDH